MILFSPPVRPSLGIIGLGAFGRLMAEDLAPHVAVLAHDARAVEMPVGVEPASLAQVSGCDIVILAVPVAAMRAVCREMAPFLKPGALVMDVGSVKVEPAAILREELPAHVDLIATHPLFGPQSVRQGMAGLKIVLCPLRGTRARRVATFLRRAFGLAVLFATPEEHDREAAFTQGLTHLIAKAMLRMEHLPERITTRSFDLIRQAVEMVRHDAVGVSRAIEQANPFSAEARDCFFAEMEAVRLECEGPSLPAVRAELVEARQFS